MLLDVDDVAMGHTGVMRWNARDKWVVSKGRSNLDCGSKVWDSADALSTAAQRRALMRMGRHRLAEAARV